MSVLKEIGKNIYEGSLDLKEGLTGKKWSHFGADIIMGFPTFKTEKTTPRLIRDSIEGSLENFPGKKIALIVVDGSYNHSSSDRATLDACLESAVRVMEEIREKERVMVIATPYDGYKGDRTPGKGSALKMIFDEMAFCDASVLILADGDLRNDMKEWHKVYKKVLDYHEKNYSGREFFVTASYARHFVDASLTRFIVGPLTTLMGSFVPGGICGDTMWSGGTVANERKAEWTERRRKYGTDISSTFDCLADDNVIIYEVYLGAKLHDITDEAKLNVMPGEVIGAALERILHYEKLDGRIGDIIKSKRDLKPVAAWSSEVTGIDFIDPGYTDIFNVDTKIKSLVEKFPHFKDYIKKVICREYYDKLEQHVEKLSGLADKEMGEVFFLNIDRNMWIDILYQALSYVLVTEDMETATRALNYLYTGAFLEFCREKLRGLGYVTMEEIRKAGLHLGVPSEKAKEYYRDEVDLVVRQMAYDFFAGRYGIKKYMDELKGGGR